MVLAWGLQEVTVRYQLGLLSTEVSAMARGSTFEGGSGGWQVSAGYWQVDAVPFYVGLLKYPHGWETDFL